MLRNLAARACVPVALAVTGFVIVCCMLLYTTLKRDLINDAVARETSLADIIVKSARYTMLKDDRESLRQTIQTLGDQQGIEHVRIFNKKGVVMYSASSGEVNTQVDKVTAGCIECHQGETPLTTLGPMEQARSFTNARGTKVLAITTPIYNEPACSQGACHFHSPDASILGTLDIGLVQTPLEKSLAALQLKMALFCAMVLILTVGGVFALLRRNVILPVRQLLSFADASSRGLAGQPPTQGAEEVEALGRIIAEQSQRYRDTAQELDRIKGKIVDLGKAAEGSDQP